MYVIESLVLQHLFFTIHETYYIGVYIHKHGENECKWDWSTIYSAKKTSSVVHVEWKERERDVEEWIRKESNKGIKQLLAWQKIKDSEWGEQE